MNPLTNVAYLGLGSNIGGREVQLRDAIRLLHGRQDINVAEVSRIYETEPVGYLDQPAFLNMACRIETSLQPVELLQATAAVEKQLGRERIIPWGPRTIDIDILTYNELELYTPELTLPHPRLRDRAFVLIPLRDVMPDMEKRLAVKLSNDVGSDNGVKLWNSTTYKPEEFVRSVNLKD